MTRPAFLAVLALLAGGTALFYARCYNPALDRALTYPFDRQVLFCTPRSF